MLLAALLGGPFFIALYMAISGSAHGDYFEDKNIYG